MLEFKIVAGEKWRKEWASSMGGYIWTSIVWASSMGEYKWASIVWASSMGQL